MTDAEKPNEGELILYQTFRIEQDRRFESDFEKEIKRIEKKKDKDGVAT